MSDTIAPPPTSRVVVGIDPSLTGTGGCRWIPGADRPDLVRITSTPAAGVRGRIDRYRRIIATLMERVPYGSFVCIEGYGFAAPGNAGLWLAELGGLLRWELLDNGCELVEVTSNQLKKFATGKGSGGKDVVMAHVAHRWGQLFGTSDECDAYVLCRIGRCLVGEERPATAEQREVVERLRGGPPVKKPRKRKAVTNG